MLLGALRYHYNTITEPFLYNQLHRIQLLLSVFPEIVCYFTARAYDSLDSFMP